MDRSLVELESIVRNRICAVCSERTADGGCGLEQSAGCALFAISPIAFAPKGPSADGFSRITLSSSGRSGSDGARYDPNSAPRCSTDG